MFKITIAGFIIVALCANFQTAKAIGLLNNPLLNNPLRNVRDIINPLRDIANEGEKAVQNLRDNVRQVGGHIVSGLSNEANKLREEGERLLNGINGGVFNNSACNKMFKELFTTMSQMASAFFSCVLNRTQSIGMDIRNLTSAAQKLRVDLVKDFRDVSECYQNPNLSCIIKSGQEIRSQIPVFEQFISAFYDILKIFPDLRMCYVTSHFKYAEQNFVDILNKLLECVGSG